MMRCAQPGILAPVPRCGRYLGFALAGSTDALAAALRRLAAQTDGNSLVVGLGLEAVTALGATVPGLRDFPRLEGAPVALPSTHRLGEYVFLATSSTRRQRESWQTKRSSSSSSSRSRSSSSSSLSSSRHCTASRRTPTSPWPTGSLPQNESSPSESASSKR